MVVRSAEGLGLLLAVVAVGAGASPAHAADWQELSNEEGIRVWSREVPDSPLVEFRGRGMVKASVEKIAAVIRDSSRKTEWLENCAEERTIRLFGVGHLWIYNRTRSPSFLISDRDVVLDAVATMLPKEKALRIDFRSISNAIMPPVDGAVRMPQVVGSWLLVSVDRETTDVTYQVQADPGGAIPSWLVNWASRRLPFRSIAALRTQADKPGYEQELALLEAAYDWTVFEQSTVAREDLHSR
jgi:hypothetical protein